MAAVVEAALADLGLRSQRSLSRRVINLVRPLLEIEKIKLLIYDFSLDLLI